MASKLEYLQRYMSSSGGDAEGDKKRKKKTKKSKKTNSGSRVVDADDAWQQSAPSREDIEKKWEMDAAEDERPLVVADGDELVDPQDLPVYVDSDKLMDEFKGKKKQKEDGDLSPPRKKRVGGDRSSEGASPPRRLKREDVSPPRRRSEAAQEMRRDSEEDVSPPRKQRRQSNGDASPPRRGKQDDASPPRRAENPTRGRRSEEDASPPRRSGKIQSFEGRRGGADDVSPPRRSSGLTRNREKNRGASPPRPVKNETESKLVEGKSTAVNDEDVSPPRRSRRDERDLKREERKCRSSPRSSAVPDRQRRVDSLGRDIPPRSGRSERRSPSASKTDGRYRDRNPAKSRSRGRGRSRDGSASPRRRTHRSRSPRPRRHRDSRSPSVRRQHSSRKSTRWGSPPRRDSRHHGSESRSRGRRRSVSPSRRSRSRSRSKSPKHRSSRIDSVEVKRERSPNSRDIRKPAEAIAEPLTATIKRETSKTDEVKTKKESAKSDGKAEKKAGLFTATEFEQQRKVAAKSKDLLHGADASEMGANAATVYRDKRGRKLDMLNEMVRQQEVLDGKRKREEREEYEWGTGEVQKRERQSKQELLEQMKKTPFARHEDDEELERKRRERVRAFDPMNSKTFQEDPLADEDKRKSKKSKKGKQKTSKAKPKYAGPPAPPNRFGITPGYRWDGVVRGTNWEEKIMMRQNANTAMSEEAYKYAVADM